MKLSKGHPPILTIETNINKKKLNRFTSLSSKATSNMGELVQSMNKICEAMIHSPTNLDFKAINYLSKNGLNTSNLLKNSIKNSNLIIDTYDNEDFLEQDLYTPKYLKEKKLPKKKSRKRNQSELYNNNNKDFDFDLTKGIQIEKNSKAITKLFKYNKKLMKMKKLNTLKSEIIMNEQKKKYTTCKSFENNFNTESLNFYRNNKKIYYNGVKSKYLNFYNENPNKTKDISLNSFSLSLRNGNPMKIYNNNNEEIKKKIEKKKIIIDPNFILNKNKNLSVDFFQNTTSNTTTNNSILSNNKNYNSSNSFRLRPFSSTTFRTKNSNNIVKEKKIFHKKLCENIISKIKNIQFDANKQSFLFKKYINSDLISKRKNFSENSKNEKQNNKKKINIEKINEEFNFTKDDKEKIFDEHDLIKNNAKKLYRHLDKRGKQYLNEVIKKMIYDDKRLHKKYIMESLFERKIKKVKMENEFNSVSHQTLLLEKKLNMDFDDNIYENERKEVKEIIHDIIKKNWFDEEELKESILRCNVMKKLQLYENNTQRKHFKYNKEVKFKDRFDKEKNNFKNFGNKQYYYNSD